MLSLEQSVKLKIKTILQELKLQSVRKFNLTKNITYSNSYINKLWKCKQ